MHKLIISNGPEINPAWTDRIAISKDYTGNGALTLTSALASGGSLIDGTKYYYKVVAIMNQQIIVNGDLAIPQVTSITLDGPTGNKLFWKLTNTTTTRKFVVSRDPDQFDIVATGTRTNDGVISLTQVNGSRISGSVTVAYTADDGGSSNILEIKYGNIVGTEETSETITTGNNTVALAWVAPIGTIAGYRVYRGTASGVYDGFIQVASTATTYSDTGAVMLSADETWFKHDIRLVSGEFLPSGNPTGIPYNTRTMLHVNFNKAERLQIIDLQSVSNQPTWNLGTEICVQNAVNDINGWL